MSFNTKGATPATSEPTYEVAQDFGTFYKTKKGDEYKLRLVAWNGRAPKWDIRSWGTDEDGNEVAHKGITFSDEQIAALTDLLIKVKEAD